MIIEGSVVVCRGRFANIFSLKGVVEVIGCDTIGVRLQNGNYLALAPEHVRLCQHPCGRS